MKIRFIRSSPCFQTLLLRDTSGLGVAAKLHLPGGTPVISIEEFTASQLAIGAVITASARKFVPCLCFPVCPSFLG